MRKITISDGTQSVVLLPDLVFTVSPVVVASEATMASGVPVRDVIGERIDLDIPTGWLPADELLVLRNMIRTGAALTIRYPDLDGDKSGKFFIDQPEYKAFKYGADGVTIWYGVTLKATGAEVHSID